MIAALRTLQEKMRRLELERAQAEKNVQRFADATQQHATASRNASSASIRLEELPRAREDRNGKQRTGISSVGVHDEHASLGQISLDVSVCPVKKPQCPPECITLSQRAAVRSTLCFNLQATAFI